MEYSIGIFFLLVMGMIIYLFFNLKESRYGKFDINLSALDYDKLINYAAQLSQNHELSDDTGNMNYLLNRLQDNYKYILKVYKRLLTVVSKKQRISGADEWLLDNFYIIEEQIKKLTKNIKRHHFKDLPLIKEGQYSGYPRIFSVVLEFINHTDGIIKKEHLRDFISEYQKNSSLSDAEIWSIPAMIEIALVENIKYLCERIERTQQSYLESYIAFEEIFVRNKKISDVLSKNIKNIKDNSAFLENITLVLKKQGKKGFNALRYIEQQLFKVNKTTDKIIEAEQQKQISRQVSMGNFISSLKYIMSINFVELFENLSEVEKILSNDPTGVYARMDKKSKNYYRKCIGKISKNLGMSETETAKEALELAISDNSHIGKYIIQTNLGEIRKNSFLKKLYFVIILLVFSFFEYVSYTISGELGAVLFIVPSLAIAINTTNYIFTKFGKSKSVLKMDFSSYVPDEYRTLVVISTLVTDEEQVEELVKKLQIYHIANEDKNICFGILGDFKDSKEKYEKKDKKILKKLEEKIDELNQKYDNKFYLFFRERTYKREDKTYMGYERKRGAIVELVKLLRNNTDNSFIKTSGNLEVKFKYVITLDYDTSLPRDSAKRLIGAMAHPMNSPVIKNGRVVSGYGIMQPSVNVDVEDAHTSPFTSIFAGQGGIDSYSGTAYDVYQDLFEEGIFSGKGIFDIDTFLSVVVDKIPPNMVLSHDLLEGCYMRAATVGDVFFTDGFPKTFFGYVKRMHRWIRGDWQLLPWLICAVKNPLNGISKWKMIDNLRRSLMYVSVFAVLVHSIYSNSFFMGVLALFSLCQPFLFSGFSNLFRLGRHHLKCHSTVFFGMRAVFYQIFFTICLLPYYAFVSADAIIRAIYRTFVSKKKILEWTTAAETDKGGKTNLAVFYKKMMVSVVLSLFFFRYLGYSLFGVLFVFAPFILYRADKPYQKDVYNLDEEEKIFLKNEAKKIWKYFEDHTIEKYNWLTPDNLQLEPPNGVAERTSPTNIGLQLMSFVTSYDLGFIRREVMLGYIEKTLDTIDKLEKWNGHLYNWYDIKTFEILRPKYISSVDSGNLCGYLITTAQALDINDKYEEKLFNRLNSLAYGMDFKPLYDKERKLFSIGYNVEEGYLTKSYYDLLASEARQLSFVAIAKGDVQKEHWFTLSRTLVMRDGYRGLLSWTGTMFEYLMPLLIMKNIPNTLLYESYHFVIRSQMKYARARNVPWGTSESAFSSFDSSLNYQYKAFGIPDLGLKRGLDEDVVVAPYASVMALMVNPEYAMENLKKLEKFSGKYGFYEAIDYTPERVSKSEEYEIVKSYMVHHLGMSMLSINNVLNNNILQKRFSSELHIKSTEELLCEKVPTNVVISKETVERIQPLYYETEENVMCYRDIADIEKKYPNVHLLSNGNYTSFINDSGCGYLKEGDIATNRFRSALEREAYGNFVYVKDIKSGDWWSTTYAPCYKNRKMYRSVFLPHKAEFYRYGNDIDCMTETIISAEENAEIKRVTLTNHTDTEMEISLCTYCEITLSEIKTDIAHPAFSNLFVKTYYDEPSNTIVAERRPRNADTTPRYAMQTIYALSGQIGKISFETDRTKFIGRYNTAENPDALKDGYEFKNSQGAVLDPIISMRILIKIPKEEKITINIVTAVCDSFDGTLKISSKYKNASNVERAFELSYTRQRVEGNYLSMVEDAEAVSYEVLANMQYILPYRKNLSSYILKNTLSQQSLWSLGISGDNPIFILKIKNNECENNLKKALKIHEFLKFKGIKSDLVVICEEETSYRRPLLTSIKEAVFMSHARDMQNVSGGVFVIDDKTVTPEVKNLLYSVARVVLDADLPFLEQLEYKKDDEDILPDYKKRNFPTKEIEIEKLDFYNGTGGFSKGEYVIKKDISNPTPMPWSNVIANEKFGFLVTENGGGYMWSINSRENKFSPWFNDSVTDMPTEMIYIKDKIYGNVIKASGGNCVVRHGAGYSVFEKNEYDISTKLTMFTPVENSVKINMLEIENTDTEEREITITYYLDVICGAFEEMSKPFIVTKNTEYGIAAHNPYNGEFKNNKVYVNLSEKPSSYTTDKNDFFGNGTIYGIPDSIRKEKLSNLLCAGCNPCIAISVDLKLNIGEKKILVISSGSENFICDYKKGAELLTNAAGYWGRILDTLKVITPDKSFDIMLNRHLLYQTVACRLFARTSVYQCGGAYGFRDQLQDVLATMMSCPDIAKEHIIRCSKHQFIEGDVQHWWHPTDAENVADKGIRTKFSDDFLWLPYVVYEYVKTTGDREIYDTLTTYIEEKPLAENEDERYGVPQISEKVNTIYGHCKGAIENALKFGEHGLPLMGSGDWNDGMNKIGNDGKGESVWLGFFLYDILKKYGYDKVAQNLKNNLNKNAWDGEWFRRAYTDEGIAVGSRLNTECKIDSISQSWSKISGGGEEEYTNKALKSAYNYLVDKENRIIKLLTPPFENSEIDAGYIKSYVPGIRENGGQYTHAAIWLIMAFALCGDGNTAYELYSMINPINHSSTPLETARYKTEPYAVAADVYSTGENEGRGGWTWYTGAAGWMYRVGTEYILGIKKEGDKLIIDPCIPTYWDGFNVKYRYKTSLYNISVKNPKGVSKREKPHSENLIDDGMIHDIIVEL